VRGRVAILSYGGMGKPWSYDVGGFKRDKLNKVHPDMVQQFQDWREAAHKHCPRVRRRKVDEHGEETEEWEYFHFVNGI